ncbi:hypothetical protein WJX82_007547 [Trebouxia sp. C0006]
MFIAWIHYVEGLPLNQDRIDAEQVKAAALDAFSKQDELRTVEEHLALTRRVKAKFNGALTMKWTNHQVKGKNLGTLMESFSSRYPKAKIDQMAEDQGQRKESTWLTKYKVPPAYKTLRVQPCSLGSITNEDNTICTNPGSCNMTTSLLADDPNAYMMKMCSPGYYGPLCSLCLLHSAPPGEPCFGRRGALQGLSTLSCQKCRNKSVIVIAGVANTLPVMLWLMYIIHVTLRENEEDAQNVPKPVRISEFLKAAQLWLQYISLLAGVNQSNQPNSFLLQMVLMAKIKLNLLPTSVASP